MPNKVALFVRDESNLPTHIQTMCNTPDTGQKIFYSYEVDFKDPSRTTSKVHNMLRQLDARIDAVFCCHGIISMGGIDGLCSEWDSLQKVNVRPTMQIMSICMPFLRISNGSVTILSASAGEHPWPGHTMFNTTMASLNMMVRVAALENAHHGVRINAVAPGYVRSDQARMNPEMMNYLDPS